MKTFLSVIVMSVLALAANAQTEVVTIDINDSATHPEFAVADASNPVIIYDDITITDATTSGTVLTTTIGKSIIENSSSSKNRFAIESGKVVLVMFKNNITFSVPDNKVITKIKLTIPSDNSWSSYNTFNGETITKAKIQNPGWTCDGASEVVFAIGGTTRISKIHVTIEDKSTEPAFISINEANTAPIESNDNAVNVNIERQINSGEWAALALPFSLDATAVKAALGDDVEVAEFTGDSEDALFFTTKDDVAISAGVPYLVKVGADITEIAVEGVTLSSETAPVSFTHYSFVPTFTRTAIADGDIYLAHNNELKIASGATINAFRAYFTPNNSSNAKTLTLCVDNNTTGIKAIGQLDDLRFDNSAIYDLQGRYVGTSISSASSVLQKGIYIINGKKVVIK